MKIGTPEEDAVTGGLYRLMYSHQLEAQMALLTAWRHGVVGQSIVAHMPFAAATKRLP